MSHRQSQGDFPQSATQDRQTPIWPGVLLILLAATFFRSLPLLENRFHPDEALYASFGRLIASGQDVLLSHVLVDKPPLSFYLTALSFLLFGNHELAARLPTLLASLVSIALVFALARRLYNRPTAYFAALALALSPFAILFSITAFVDPLLTALVLWGLWLILRRRYRRAGLAFALAFATKQTALLFVPLALAFGLLALPATATVQDALRQLRSIASPLLGGLVLVTLTVLTWEVARRPPISFWEQGYTDNAPGRFIRANEVLPRARAWLALLDYTTASAPLNSLFLLGLPVLLIAGLRDPSRAALADLLLAGYGLLYLAGYWLLAFNVWDRYLVPVLPFLAILLGRIADRLWRMAYRLSPLAFREAPLWGRLLPSAFCLVLLPSALRAAHSGYPIGGDHGAYDGIDHVARFARTLPEGGVLYDHWLSWELSFYFFDGPLYVAWFPTPEALATDLRAFGRASPRYLVVPSWESDAEVRAAADRAGFGFVPLHTTFRRDGSASFVVYRLSPTQ